MEARSEYGLEMRLEAQMPHCHLECQTLKQLQSVKVLKLYQQVEEAG